MSSTQVNVHYYGPRRFYLSILQSGYNETTQLVHHIHAKYLIISHDVPSPCSLAEFQQLVSKISFLRSAGSHSATGNLHPNISSRSEFRKWRKVHEITSLSSMNPTTNNVSHIIMKWRGSKFHSWRRYTRLNGFTKRFSGLFRKTYRSIQRSNRTSVGIAQCYLQKTQSRILPFFATFEILSCLSILWEWNNIERNCSPISSDPILCCHNSSAKMWFPYRLLSGLRGQSTVLIINE